MTNETDARESKLVADVRDAANRVRDLRERIEVVWKDLAEAEDNYLDALDRLNATANPLPTDSLTAALTRRRERGADA